MKKILALLFVLLLVPALANAQALIVYRETTGTLAWDASPKVVTTDQANMYQVMWRTDLVSAGTALAGGPILLLQQAITVPVDQAAYYFGVKALRRQNNATVSESAIAWSSDPAATANKPFMFNTIVAPSWPGGIRFTPPTP